MTRTTTPLARAQRARALLERLAPAVLAPTAREALAAMARDLDWKLLPALRLGSERPALVVLAGHTNAGKSTLLNQVAQAEVSAASERAAATRSAVAVGPPAALAGLGPDGYLAQLDQADAGADQAVVLSWHLLRRELPSLPEGVVWIDSPDVSTVDDRNRALGRSLALAADLVVFVSTPQTYADALPLELLSQALRGRELALVLNMCSDARQAETIVRDLRGRILPGVGLEVSTAPAWWAPWLAADADAGLPLQFVGDVDPVEFSAELAALARRAARGAPLRSARAARAELEAAKGEILAGAREADDLERRVLGLVDDVRRSLRGEQIPFLEAIDAAARVRRGLHHRSYAWLIRAAQAPARGLTTLVRSLSSKEAPDPYAARDAAEIKRIAVQGRRLRTRLLEELEGEGVILEAASAAARALPRDEALSDLVLAAFRERAGGSRALVDQLVEDWQADLEERPVFRTLLGLADLGIGVGGAMIGIALTAPGLPDLVAGVLIPPAVTAVLDQFGYPIAVKQRYERFLEERARLARDILHEVVATPVLEALRSFQLGAAAAELEAELDGLIDAIERSPHV